MVVETFEKMRGWVGEEFPILIKINCTDGIEQGISLEDCKYVCRELSWLGIDAIEISGNWMQLRAKEQPYFIDSAKETKCVSCNACATLESMGKCILNK
jgi:2,4-dienoyl-CoA reductase-like NADH-dependent reductase (Old Yellow Enzyme family)